MIFWPDFEDIVEMHDNLIIQFGGTFGIRDKGLLVSALEEPRQTMFGKEIYPNTESKVCEMSYLLTMNHCFIDGNKRIGAFALVYYLNKNGISFKPAPKELTGIFFSLAAGRLSRQDFFEWVASKANVRDFGNSRS